MASIKDHIKQKKFEKCYLLFGEENFLMTKGAKELEKAVLDGSDEVMNKTVFEGMADIGTIIDSCETMPFFSEKRVVVVKDSGLFKEGRKNDSEKMTDFLSDITESTCLIFEEKNVDKRSRIYKAIQKTGFVQEFAEKKDIEAAKDIVSIFKREKISCSQEDALYIIHCVGTSMESLEKEVKKLISYIGQEGSVTKEIIDLICTKTVEAKVFDLVTAVGERNPSKAVEIYRNLLMYNEAPIKILFLIARQFRIMYQCSLLLKEGKTINEIIDITGQKYYSVKECSAQSRNFTAETIKKAIIDCLETDYNIKSGKIDDEIAVEIIIVKYST